MKADTDDSVRKRPAPVAWWVSLDYLLTYVGYYGLLPLLAIFLTDELGAQPSELGLVLLLFTLAVRGSSVLVGASLDRAPLKIAAVVALLVAATAFALTSLASTPAQALPLLVLGGFGFSLHGVAARALLAEQVVDRTENLRAFALVNMFVNVAAAAGPLLGGLLLHRDRLRLAPLLVAIGCVAGALVVAAALPSRPRPLQLSDADESSPYFHRLFASRRVPFAVYGRLFADDGFRRLSLVNFVGWFLYAQLFSALPIYLFTTLDSNALLTTLFSLNGVLIILGQWPISSAIARRLADDRRAVPDVLVVAVGVLASSLLLVAASSVAPALLYLAVVVFTVGEMMFVPTADSVYGGFADQGQLVSTYNGKKITMAAGEALGAFSGASVSLVVARLVAPSAYWLLVGGLALACTPLLLSLARGAQKRAVERTGLEGIEGAVV